MSVDPTLTRATSVERMLSVRGLTKVYGDLAAVQDVDLGVSPGEVLGLLGPNGSGKSTTLNMGMGFIRPSRGRL